MVYAGYGLEVTLTEEAYDAIDEVNLLTDLTEDAMDYIESVLEVLARQVKENFPSVIAEVKVLDR